MALTRDEEIVLVRDYQSSPGQNSPAFARMFQEYDRQIWGHLRARCRDDRDAEEIKQETWLRFSRGLPRFDPTRAPIIAMLKLTATQAAIDYYRVGARGRKLTIFLEDLRLIRQRWGSGDEREEADDGRQDGTVLDSLVDWETRESLLRVAYQQLNKAPHELITYGFHMYLEWKPRELVEETFTGRWLSELTEQFVDDFACASGVPKERLEPIFARLRQSVSSPDIGRMPFRSCFRTTPPEEDIRKWSFGVFRATVIAARRTYGHSIVGGSR